MSAVPTPPARPAEQLTGIVLASGWLITERATKPAGHTGGNFCINYFAERNGERAFVKAIDFVGAMGHVDPLAELQRLTSDANFERDVLRHCGDAKMSRVVRLLDSEYVSLPAFADDPLRRVFCLILEIGNGDIRKHADFAVGASAAWKLAVLKDVSLGLYQLHRRDIAHLDVKPSNVLTFKDNLVKLGDLGRVVRKNSAGPFDSVFWPGDGQYSPPEVWYGFRPAEWADRRIAGDIYLLGNLFYYLFVGVSFSAALSHRTPSSYLPGKWMGSFEDAAIVLRDVQVRLMRETFLGALPQADRITEELHGIALQLTHPDPRKRGDVDGFGEQSVSLGAYRYISKFDRLAKRVEILERVAR